MEGEISHTTAPLYVRGIHIVTLLNERLHSVHVALRSGGDDGRQVLGSSACCNAAIIAQKRSTIPVLCSNTIGEWGAA